jgi:hypothetical protein
MELVMDIKLSKLEDKEDLVRILSSSEMLHNNDIKTLMRIAFENANCFDSYESFMAYVRVEILEL